jgi:transposase
MKKLACVALSDQARIETRPCPGEDVYIAVDLARSKWVYGVRWGEGLRRCLSSPWGVEHLAALVKQYAACRIHVVFEACGFGYELAWWCQEQGHDVMVIAPSRVSRPPGLAVKTDRVDVRTMARKREQGELKGIYIPNRAEHERRQLSRAYAQALKECKRARVRVRSLMQEHGRIGPGPKAGWAAYAQWLEAQTLPEPVAICVEELLRMRAAAVASAARLKQALGKLAREARYAPLVQAVQKQAGVGMFTAIRLVLELGDITRFPTAGSIVNYLGLTPSQYSSGELDHRGHLIKCGPGFIRAWALQCAWAAVRTKDADSELRQCFDRLVPRVGRKRAIIAVARRLVLRVRARWLEALREPAPNLV